MGRGEGGEYKSNAFIADNSFYQRNARLIISDRRSFFFCSSPSFFPFLFFFPSFFYCYFVPSGRLKSLITQVEEVFATGY